MTAFAQRKYAAMASLRSDLVLKIVAPSSMPHVFMHYTGSRNPDLPSGSVQFVKRRLGTTHMTYVLDPVALFDVMKRFTPDRIHIEEDPHAFISVETVTLTRLLSKRPHISFFIWDNLARTPRIPVKWLKRALSLYSMSTADLIVCGNEEAANLLRGRKGFRGAIRVLPQVGLDEDRSGQPERDELRRGLGVNRDDILVGYVGRFAPEKGLRVLLSSTEEPTPSRWKLLLMGSGSMDAEIREGWHQRIGDRLVLRPPVRHEEVPAVLRALDIFVLPSRTTPVWKEQFGLTLAQAMLAGTACIGSASGAIPEVLGGAGLIVREGDPVALRSAIDKLAESPTHRHALADLAQRRARSAFTNDKVAAGYLSAFESLGGQH